MKHPICIAFAFVDAAFDIAVADAAPGKATEASLAVCFRPLRAYPIYYTKQVSILQIWCRRGDTHYPINII